MPLVDPPQTPSSHQRPGGHEGSTSASSSSFTAAQAAHQARTFLNNIHSHPTFNAFLDPDFDPASYASKIVIADASDPNPGTKSRAEMVVQEISAMLGRVDEAIDRHVLQHQKELTDSLGNLGEIRDNCNVLSIRIKDLKRSADKVKNELLEPYQSIELRTTQLRRIHDASDLLKKVSRFSFTLAKLYRSIPSSSSSQAALVDLREMAKAASHLEDLESLMKDPNLASLNQVRLEQRYLVQTGRMIRQSAKDRYKEALVSMNQADLGPALQVFYNLQCLPQVVLEGLASIIGEVLDITRKTLEPQTLEKVYAGDTAGGEGASSSPSGGSPPPVGPSQSQGSKSVAEMEAISLRQRRARLRDHCEKWGNALYDASMKVWNLQRVLLKKQDAITNEQFLEVVLGSPIFRESVGGSTRSRHGGAAVVGSFYWKYWTDLTQGLNKIVKSLSARRPGVNHMVRAYPYLSMALLTVLSRLADHTCKQDASLGAYQSVQRTTKGNAAAMRALMEALDVDERGEEGDMEGGDHRFKEEAPAELGTSEEERVALLDSLANIREIYLGESLQRLSRPVEQMFPQVDGYQSAIPSKHDLQSFIKVIQGELSTGLVEGGPMLLPLLVRSAIKAVRLFCSKVESMTNTTEGAKKFYPLRSWAITPEKEHNLQLLHLLAVLHGALRKMPRGLAQIGEEFIGGPVGAGGMGTGELEEACRVVEDLAVGAFLRPYLTGLANELGSSLANMHIENFAPKDDQSLVNPDCSRFMTDLQDSIAAIRKNHLAKFPTSAEFTVRGFKWLVGRLLRLYVSHAALIRPLNDKGKSKLTRDMAMLETILSSITKVSDVGPAYQELRAFRGLVFFGDEQTPITVAGIMKEAFLQHLRPSTVLDFLFGRAPPELSSPHVIQRCSEKTMIEELLSIYFADKPPPSKIAEAGDDPRVAAEKAHWQVVQVCLDAYVQRMSAQGGELAYIYDIILNSGALVVKAYSDAVTGSENVEQL